MINLRKSIMPAVALLATGQTATAKDFGASLPANGVLQGATNDNVSSRTVRFMMQGDCNLVAYQHGGAVWSSKTNGKGTNCKAVMQADGNLVVYRGDGKALWSSNTHHYPGGQLLAQQDGNVVIYQGKTARWATNTVLPQPPKGSGGPGGSTPFPGCRFAKTETKCVIVTFWTKEVYQCGWNGGSLTPIEKSTDWHLSGACVGFDW